MSTIVETVDVAVPVSTAYNQWTQFESFPAFMEGVENIRQVDDRRTHWVTKIGGVTREFDATITEQIPDERVAWKSTDGPEHAGVITFHRLNERETRVTAQMDIDPEGFVENVADKLGVIDRRVKSDMRRFKEFIEDRGREGGAWRGEVDAAGQVPPAPKPGPGAFGGR
ncbi:putative membrane protein [Actinokineospora baliensis]|uniref:SRPBCC family protein n=1 Tax=Actinokineospora baliensis TaxID=547056 RepID=UPI0019573228|nr:SRPBCC family protein [Actinokineospora baliensis]MBM7770834.1 putative membrane protein [Actinokineospora baliensis]